MNFEEATSLLNEGKNVRLPEWRGYWTKKDGVIMAFTKNGDYELAWKEGDFKNRDDWEIADGLDFGWALCALKAGKLVTRKGCNDKDTFIFLTPEKTLDDTKEMKFSAYISIKESGRSIVSFWNATQSDMLSEDWSILE